MKGGESMSDIFRKVYTPISIERKVQIDAVKDLAQALYDKLIDSDLVALSSGRENALAKTKLEEAIMWAVKGLTA